MGKINLTVSHHHSTTVDREIFVLKYFRATIFRGVKFSLSGPSTKIYHRVHITATSTEGLFGLIVASAFILGGSCCRSTLVREPRPLRTIRAVAVNGCIDIDGTVIAHFKYVPRKDRLQCIVWLTFLSGFLENCAARSVLARKFTVFLFVVAELISRVKFSFFATTTKKF